jgi:hypothetical protein
MKYIILIIFSGLVFRLDEFVFNQSQERLVGVWIMVKSEKNGEPRFDESIEQKYTYSFNRNGDYILDFRLVRKSLEGSDLSIIDFPKIKWSTNGQILELKALDSKGGVIGTTSYNYFFSSDTLITDNKILKEYYLKVNEK